MNPDTLLATAAVDVRAGDRGIDGIDGVVPGIVIEPQSAEAVAAALQWASAERLTVVVRGAGTKMHWGRVPGRVDAVLSMRRLNRLLTHRHGDLTATVEAGLPLSALNRQLAAHVQQLPLDPPFAEEATIGGLLATNDSGPSRHRFGTPRDLVIGVQIATTDGRLVKAGGQVVKNVAGYDLSKLVSGSFGTLAAIVSATFKLSPLPEATATVTSDAGGADRFGQIVTAIAASQLEPVAFECHWRRDDHDGRTSCLLRFASLETAVEAQVSEARARIAAAGRTSDIASGVTETNLWRAHVDGICRAPGALLRASWLPADITKVVETLERTEGAVELIGRIGLGAGMIRIEGGTAAQAEAIHALRRTPILGNVVLLRGSRELKMRVDVWGPSENARVIESVKRALDPHGTLGGRRYP